MFLKASVSSTKKFFKKTIEGFKSFLSNGYEKLPQSPPCNLFSCNGCNHVSFTRSYRELDKFYTEFTSDHHRVKDSVNRSSTKKTTQTGNQEICNGNLVKESPRPTKRGIQLGKQRREIVYEGERKQLKEEIMRREERRCLIAGKMKEMEMMDGSNVEHDMDMEEVLHYYSRLTCPAYLQIVDNFFMQIYSELVCSHQLQQSSSVTKSSRPRLR